MTLIAYSGTENWWKISGIPGIVDVAHSQASHGVSGLETQFLHSFDWLEKSIVFRLVLFGNIICVSKAGLYVYIRM